MPRTHDGQSVDSGSHAWRQHCEARHLLQLPGYRCIDAAGRWITVSARRQRQQYLERVLAARGRQECEQLAALALRLWMATTPGEPDEDDSR
ncbi:hypothetical protein ACODUL_06410 [Stenotrophomonas maltophilia]